MGEDCLYIRVTLKEILHDIQAFSPVKISSLLRNDLQLLIRNFVEAFPPLASC
ncbi:hypothetical protein D3C87_1478490 [compost metagenome]